MCNAPTGIDLGRSPTPLPPHGAPGFPPWQLNAPQAANKKIITLNAEDIKAQSTDVMNGHCAAWSVFAKYHDGS